jgi:ribonuclease HI
MKYVYTDGSCKRNGKTNPDAGIGIYFGDDDSRNVSKKIYGKQTNNSAELSAIIEVFDIIKDEIEQGEKYTIVTDSEYVIKCVSTYGEKMEKINWKKDIPNKELVQMAYLKYKNIPNITFMHVMAHTNAKSIHAVGNAQADKLATLATN